MTLSGSLYSTTVVWMRCLSVYICLAFILTVFCAWLVFITCHSRAGVRSFFSWLSDPVNYLLLQRLSSKSFICCSRAAEASVVYLRPHRDKNSKLPAAN